MKACEWAYINGPTESSKIETVCCEDAAYAVIKRDVGDWIRAHGVDLLVEFQQMRAERDSARSTVDRMAKALGLTGTRLVTDCEALAAEVERLRAEVERLKHLLGLRLNEFGLKTLQDLRKALDL